MLEKVCEQGFDGLGLFEEGEDVEESDTLCICYHQLYRVIYGNPHFLWKVRIHLEKATYVCNVGHDVQDQGEADKNMIFFRVQAN